MRANYYQELLASEARRICAGRKAGANVAAMQDTARERVAKLMEQRTRLLTLLFEARRATLLVPSPWGQAPNWTVQNVIM